MLRYTIRRVLAIIPTVLAVIIIVFTIQELTPGTPGRAILGATAKQEQVDALNHDLGYDKPYLTRLVNYIAGVARGNLGISYSTRKPVIKEIIIRFPHTFIIALISMVGSALIGIPLGVFSAVRQYSMLDYLGTTLAVLLASAPVFWLAIVLAIVFALKLKILPANGIGSWKHYVLPGMTLTLSQAGIMLRMTRTSMLESIRQDYIRTARAKGAPKRSVIWNHALKNALMPVVTTSGLGFATQLGGTVLVESVFALPGLGLLIINSITGQDYPMVIGATIFLSVLFCVIMLIVDLIYGFIDPRIKAKFIK